VAERTSADGTGEPPGGLSEAERALGEFLALNRSADADIDHFCSSRPHIGREVRRLYERWRDLEPLIGSLFDRDQLGASLMRMLGGSEQVTPESAEAPQEDSDPQDTLKALASHGGDARRYRIDRGEPLGQGGMGTIHRAWDKNLRRWVVRKVLDRGPSTEPRVENPRDVPREQRALSRFLDEALVTGQLDHPGIVPVHELGVTEGGQAFFTMKMVEGQDLRHILDRLAAGATDWTVNRIVGVLRRVCEAVAYAHSKGVLHRDIKPANIMVGRFGEAYLMDWGLARIGEEQEPAMNRATSGSADGGPLEGADSCLYTHDGEVLGTPVYMAPEQAAGDVADIDERSDVYSLGVILYQVLTSRMAYVGPDEKPMPFEVLMRVRRGPPQRVSELAPHAAHGLVEICERAMARDPAARFQTADRMAAELGDYLEDISEDREEARRQARRAELINRFLMDALGSADPANARGRDVTVREIVEQAASRIERSEQLLEPVDRATLHGTLGSLFARMGSNERSQLHLVKARELQEGLFGPRDSQFLQLASELATTLRRLGRAEEAEQLLRSTLLVQRAEFGVDDQTTLKTMDGLAMVLDAMGRFREAESFYTDVLAARRSVLGRDARETLVTLNSLGNVLKVQGRLTEAEPLLRQAIEGLNRTVGEDHPSSLTSMGNLGTMLLESERYEEASEIHRKALEIKRNVLGPEHPEVVTAMNNLGMNLTKMSCLEEAEDLLRSAIQIQESSGRSGHLINLSLASNLGLVLLERGDLMEAEALFRHALEGAESVTGLHRRIPARFRFHLGRLLLVTCRFEEAEPELLTAYEALQESRDVNVSWAREAANAVAELFDQRGEPERAAEYRAAGTSA
jgi:serine/threonine protein kinase